MCQHWGKINLKQNFCFSLFCSHIAAIPFVHPLRRGLNSGVAVTLWHVCGRSFPLYLLPSLRQHAAVPATITRRYASTTGLVDALTSAPLPPLHLLPCPVVAVHQIRFPQASGVFPQAAVDVRWRAPSGRERRRRESSWDNGRIIWVGSSYSEP